MAQTVEIIIVDYHKIFRVGLKSILESISNVSVIGETENGVGLFKLLKTREPDIVFMDVTLGGENGIDLTRKLVARYPDILVIAMTSSDEVNNINHMLDAGATGYLLKNATEKEIELAIESVINGDNYFSKEFLNLAKVFNRKPRKKSQIILSKRETEVLAHICHGASNQEIADAMKLSVHTVDSHRRNLLLKTNSRNSAKLVMIAFKEGLINYD